VLDVWFDSGVAGWASLGYPAKEEPFRSLYPVDFITEGHDQTRGWFYSQLGCGLLAFDEVPYRRVLMHGFTLDEKGEKMSKSLGNVVTPEEVIERFSADVLRFYVLWANKPWEDLRFNWDEVKVVAKMFNILWNVYVFATTYMSLDGFTPEKVPRNLAKNYRSEDRWILSRLNSVIREVNEAFETLHLYRATRALNEFIVEDLSRWYITLVRPRTWEERESIDKIAAYSVLYRVLSSLAKLLAPIVPHLSEEIYQNLVVGLDIGEDSVHLERFPSPREEYIDGQLERHMRVARGIVEATASAREKLGVKRRWPVLRLIFSPADEEAAQAARNLEELIRRQGNALRLEVLQPGEEPAELELVAEPKFSALGPEFKALAREVAEAIRSADARKLHEGIQKGGYKLTAGGEEVLITARHVEFRKRLPEHMAKASFEHGAVYIDATKTREIMELGFAREVVRRIQEMRKELDLAVEAYISTRVSVSDEEIVDYLEAQRDYIARETRSKQLEIATQLAHEGYEKVWKIAGKEFRISIREVE
jgi:isoleucyl-tRNA synthetase